MTEQEHLALAYSMVKAIHELGDLIEQEGIKKNGFIRCAAGSFEVYGVEFEVQIVLESNPTNWEGPDGVTIGEAEEV